MTVRPTATLFPRCRALARLSPVTRTKKEPMMAANMPMAATASGKMIASVAKDAEANTMAA